MTPNDINLHPIHLGRNATPEVEPEFTGDPQWYEDYGSRHAEDGVEGRLVSMYRFTSDWDSWEVHPHGSEAVLCVAGAMTLHQENADGSRATVTLTRSSATRHPLASAERALHGRREVPVRGQDFHHDA